MSEKMFNSQGTPKEIKRAEEENLTKKQKDQSKEREETYDAGVSHGKEPLLNEFKKSGLKILELATEEELSLLSVVRTPLDAIGSRKFEISGRLGGKKIEISYVYRKESGQPSVGYRLDDYRQSGSGTHRLTSEKTELEVNGKSHALNNHYAKMLLTYLLGPDFLHQPSESARTVEKDPEKLR